MFITVITVCRNAAGSIRDALESVAVQTHPEVEHVVIDGASTDGTVAVVQACRQRVSELVSEPDQGIFDAWNKGLARARGEIIAFLNADDVYAHPGVLELVCREMHSGQLDALLGDVAFYRPHEPGRVVRRYDSTRFRPDRVAWGWMPAHPAMFLHRRVYERVGSYRTDYRIAADFEFVVRAFQPGRIRYRHWREVLVRMRTGGNSRPGWCNTLLLNQEVVRACRENGVQTNLFKVMSKYPAKLLEYVRK